MLESLIKVIQPPKNPNEVGNLQGWIDVEEKLGVKLPNDYKEFISVYGRGRIGDFLWVLNPFSNNTNVNLFDSMEHFQWAYGVSKEKFPEDCPRHIFPENHSLFIWGATDNGDYLFWIYDENKDPNQWKIGVYDSRAGEESEIFNMNMSSFLEKLAKNEIETDAFPEDFLEMKNKKFQTIHT